MGSSHPHFMAIMYIVAETKKNASAVVFHSSPPIKMLMTKRGRGRVTKHGKSFSLLSLCASDATTKFSASLRFPLLFSSPEINGNV